VTFLKNFFRSQSGEPRAFFQTAVEPALPGRQQRPLEGVVQGAAGGVYFTAPKVRPCTSCFWLNQPNTTMGPMAMNEAADSLAQNSPSGLE
jgi:hypothetical protein